MRILITLLFVLTIGVITYAQVPSSFRGTLNIYQSSGTAPNFEIRGIFNDTQGVYTSDSVDVGDKVYIISDGTCTSLTVTSIISTSGGVIRVNVTDDYATLSNAPLGNAAIMEITPNQQFPTFVDGISYDLLSCIQTHFALLVDDLSFTIPPMPQAGNTQDTVVQVSHGLSLLDPVFVNTSGNWIVSNISNDDSLHMAVVTEVISADTLILTYSGITTQTAHGYTVGHVYFVQDDGSYADTVPPNLINDIAFYVVSPNKLFITEQRAFTPSTDLNGIYSGSNYVPSGTIAYVDNFQIKDSLDKFIINVNPENDNMSLRGDSITMTFETDNGLVVIDQNTPKTGIRYAASGYVNNDLSLTTKEYVDDAIAGIVVHPEVTVTDGTTIDFTISPLQVLTGEVVSNSITASHIATSAVTTTEILDGTILTTDLSFTVNGGSGVANQVTYWTATNTLASDSDLQFNGTLVGIGQAVGTGRVEITGTGTGTNPTLLLQSSTGTDNFIVRDNGTVDINGGSFIRQNGGSGGLRINGNDWIFYNQGNNEIARFTTVNTGTNGGLTVSGANGVTSTSFSNIRTLNATSSVTSSIYQGLTINPTSGTGAFYNLDIANTINQTGGANGIVRDIYIHPTLTSAADYRALEIGLASGKGIWQTGVSATNRIDGNIGIGLAPIATAQLALSASTASEASINIAAGSAPTTPVPGDVWSDSSQKALIANQAGVNQALVGTIFTGTANATTNNTNADVSITPTGVGTLTLPANFFVAGKKLRVALNGNYTTDAVTTPTLRLKLKAGSTTIATFSANTIPTKTSNGIFTAEFVVTCRTTGVSGTVMGFGEMELNDTETTRDASWKTPATSTFTLDTTTSQALTVTAAFGTADTDNSITVTQISVEILN